MTYDRGADSGLADGSRPTHRHGGQDRRYYLEELDMSSSPESNTGFLNVDLDLQAQDGLDDLVDALGASVIVLQSSAHRLSLEMAEPFSSVEETLRGWTSLVERLSPEARRIWERCEFRCFNIGIQAGKGPQQECFMISKRAVSLFAGLQADIAMTVYAPE
jgi:hypothetical protein